ncbi:hypothetical protein KG089_01660 [Carnobacteriaceae bacterium zg-ZUI252]|nr:hypothetical protein [Carnobacteriaceae bacterium zg-ZUI252]QTU83545.1 hypothetical protein J7S27_03215 [Carnobacteriaceae bacterium zg-C25]
MKKIKLAWNIFKFMTLVLPIINFILDRVATYLEYQNAKGSERSVR